MEEAQQRANAAEKSRVEMAVTLTRTNTLMSQLRVSVTELTLRAVTAEKQLKEAHQSVKKAEKRRNEMSIALQRTKDANTELRGCQSEYSRMQKEYPKVKNQRDQAERQVAELTNRVETVEKQLKALHKNVQVEPTTNLSFATRIWPKVAKVLGLDEADIISITRAARSMHDTKSEDWEHSLRNRTQLSKRLPAAVRLLLSNLFRCVRVHSTTIPVEDILDYVYRRKVDDTKLLGDIRQAVRTAIKERRLTDAKVLLTLSMSSFGKRRQIQKMKRFFSYSEPIFVGSTVTFMKPKSTDQSPVDKTASKRMATTPVGKTQHVTTSSCHHHVTM